MRNAPVSPAIDELDNYFLVVGLFYWLSRYLVGPGWSREKQA